jgi:predicted PurR-regulated permease PerM
MESEPENSLSYTQSRALLLLVVIVSIALGVILLPFYEAILWGGIIALLFTPVQRRLLRLLRGRKTLAAVLTLLLVLVILIIPLTLISASLAHEAVQVFQHIQSGRMDLQLAFGRIHAALPEWLAGLLDRFGLVDLATLQARITALLAQTSQLVARQALNIGQVTVGFVIGLVIALYLAFFLIRDGSALARTVERALPLAPEHKKELFSKFATVIRATVKGSLVVAIVQGTLGGLAFWFLGVTGALLWAVVMAFLSLLPAVGAALVWAPVAIYFLLTGGIWQSVALVIYGVVVIGLVDNVLRPILVGKDTRMPDYVVLISTLGGAAVFGLSGLVIGPAIAAMFIAVWHIYALRGEGLVR